MRLRQLVIAAESLETADTLKTVLGLGAPFADPGVAAFGLVNAVFAVGDQFLEIVVPTAQTAPAQRFIQRSGEGGYMAIFETGDMAAVRQRADRLGIRRVWEIDLPDIAASHLHPSDLGAAIVSVDQPVPAGAWRWGGPDWTRNSVPGGLAGACLESPDPARLARRWGEVLGVIPTQQGDGLRIELAGGTLDVRPGAVDRLSEFQVRLPSAGTALSRAREQGLDADETGFTIAGVRVALTR